MYYVDSEHIQDWLSAGRAHLVEARYCARFHDWLLGLPWLPSTVDWSELPHRVLDCSSLSDDEIPVQVERYPIAHNSHLMAMYTPDQPGLICTFEDGIKNLDLLFWKAPGVRYFCGANPTADAINPRYVEFGEFDGQARIRIYLGSDGRIFPA